MDSLIFAFNAVSPIIATVAIGYILKKIGLMNEDFSKKANKLVFRVFLPIKLFLNIYGIKTISSVNLGYVVYALVALLVVFALAIPTVIFVTKKKKCRGALLQGIFRSNYALIGIPLASLLFDAEGEEVATLLSAFIVPAFNVLAVIGLSVFNNEGKKPSFKKIILGIVKNPLIIGIVSGLAVLGIRAILQNNGISFRISDIPVVWKTADYLSSIATPLALIVLGAQFEFSAIPTLKREIISGVLLRSVIVPLLCLGTAYILFKDNKDFGGAQFAALVAAFCTPVAVSSVPMAQEMGADTDLAGQLVVFTTIASGLTVFVASFALKQAGIF
jgi:predicted permease